jgi:peptidoglycan/LPS O-acetylase OafA/YrhL
VVSFFFILTGAGISIRYWTAIFGGETAPSAKQAFWKRLAKLAPAYWVALFASFLLALVMKDFSWEWIVRLLSGIFFLSWAHPSTFFPVEINGPLWYIPFDVVGSAMAF